MAIGGNVPPLVWQKSHTRTYLLLKKSKEQIEQDGEQKAQHDRGSQREKETEVTPLKNKIPRELPQEGTLLPECEPEPGQNQDGTKNYE